MECNIAVITLLRPIAINIAAVLFHRLMSFNIAAVNLLIDS